MRKIVLIFLILFPLGLLGATGISEQGVGVDLKAEVTFLDGTMTLNGKQVDVGTPVKEGAVVVTGPDSQAEIIFAGKNILSLGPSTTVILSLTTLKKTLELKAGSLGAVFKKLDRLAGGTLDLRTPTVSGAIRGTSFYTSVDTEKNTYFCTCNGSILLKEDSQEIPTKNAHHGAYYFKNTPAGVLVEGSILKDHDDLEMETLASKIDYKINWAIPD